MEILFGILLLVAAVAVAFFGWFCYAMSCEHRHPYGIYLMAVVVGAHGIGVLT